MGLTRLKVRLSLVNYRKCLAGCRTQRQRRFRPLMDLRSSQAGPGPQMIALIMMMVMMRMTEPQSLMAVTLEIPPDHRQLIR